MYPTTSGVIVMDAAAELFPSNSQQSPLRERRPEKGRTAGGIFAALLARAAVNAAHYRSTQLPITGVVHFDIFRRSTKGLQCMTSAKKSDFFTLSPLVIVTFTQPPLPLSAFS